jgi:hypothetical protein
VYDIEEHKKEPIGGAARFATALNHYKKQYDHSILAFSGDCFFPSL